MSLVIEAFGRAGWLQVGEPLRPGDQPGSMSHNPPEGGRQVITFQCLGDRSVIRRSRLGVDVEFGEMRAVSNLAGYEEIASLDAENPVTELLVKTDRSYRPVQMRFKHVP